MLVTCKGCKSKIDRDAAYKVIIKNKNNYYCNVTEYENQNIENESRLKCIDLIFEILGETTNTNLFKEISEIGKVHTYAKFFKYLEANIYDLNKIMSKGFNTEYGKIRYFSTILKNQIGDFVEQNEDTEIYNIDVIEEVKYTPTKKKSFTDFIDEY